MRICRPAARRFSYDGRINQRSFNNGAKGALLVSEEAGWYDQGKGTDFRLHQMKTESDGHTPRTRIPPLTLSIFSWTLQS